MFHEQPYHYKKSIHQYFSCISSFLAFLAKGNNFNTARPDESSASPVHVECTGDLLQSGQGTDLKFSYVKVLLNMFYNPA